MTRLLESKIKPTAVVAGYDSIALGAYRALSEHGLSIPEHFALVSFDDASFCRYLPCTITTVNYDANAESRVAAAILLSRIENSGTDFTQAVAIIPKLMVRESTDKH